MTTHNRNRTPTFEPGDLVVDLSADRDDRGTAVVVQTHDTPANAYTVESLDSSVAAVPTNQTYPETDPVVEVIFEGHLDRTVVDWRPMLRDTRNGDPTFWELLTEYRDEWGVSLREYAYPDSRLAPRPYCPECNVRAEYVPRSTDYVCPVAGCTATPETNDALNADDESPRPGDAWTREQIADRSMRGDD